MHVTQRVWLLMFDMHMICDCFICSDVRVIIREPRTWEPSFEEKIVPPDAFQENTRELVTNLGPMAPIWRFTKCLFSVFFVFTFSGWENIVQRIDPEEQHRLCQGRKNKKIYHRECGA